MSPLSKEHPLPRLSRRVWRVARLTAHEFLGDRCFDKSASLAYVSLLGIFAVVTVVLSVQAIIFSGNPALENRLKTFIFENLFPDVTAAPVTLPGLGFFTGSASPEGAAGAPSLAAAASSEMRARAAMDAELRERRHDLEGIVEKFRESAPGLGAVGIIGLVIVSMMLFTSVEKGFNEVFHVRRKRPIVRAFVTYTAVLVWVPIFIGLTIAMALNVSRQVPWLSPRAASLVLTCLTFALAYWMIPNTRVSPVTALMGGILAGFVWEAAKIGFVLYVQGVAPMQNFLLTLGVIPTFLIWIYLTWVVLFLGLELCYVLQHYSPLAGRVFQREAPLELNPRHLLTALHELAVRFERGEPRVTIADLMKVTHLDEQRIHQILDHCEDRGWIFATEAGAVYHLARPPEKIPLRDILLSPVSQVVEIQGLETLTSLEEFWRRYDRAAEAALPVKTLKDIVSAPRPSGAAAAAGLSDAP